MFFFFKQKTAYEMRISDWSSDVCSSDLRRLRAGGTDPREDGQGGDPRGRCGRGTGGEDLQQYAARRLDDRDMRKPRPRAEAGARSAEILRHRERVVRAMLVADQLRAASRRRPGQIGRAHV